MSSTSWPLRLTRVLASRTSPDSPPRVAIVGVGQAGHGDDAAGLAAVQGLQRRLRGVERLLAISAGPAPENVTGVLRRFRPDLVILVDAAVMGEPPGTVQCLDPAEIDGISASSHTLPLRLVATFLMTELQCAVLLLGIEPAHSDVLAPLSPPVRLAVTSVVRRLAATLLTWAAAPAVPS